jgi:hypothetical protein
MCGLLMAETSMSPLVKNGYGVGSTATSPAPQIADDFQQR